MAKKTAALLPATDALLQAFGERLRLARRRRRLTAAQVAERAGMAPMTLRSLEHGGAGVTMGAYLAVMQVLGIESDLELLASADPLGRELQDARLGGAARVRQPIAVPAVGEPSGAYRPAASPAPRASSPNSPPNSPPNSRPKRAAASDAWIADGGFADAAALAGLIAPPKPARRR